MKNMFAKGVKLASAAPLTMSSCKKAQGAFHI